MNTQPVIGILGGSFNPVHAGHLMVADFIAQTASLDAVWLSLSPANPLKATSINISDEDRMNMLTIAVDGHPRLKAINDELSLPRPSYTLTLLNHLSEKYPEHQFKLIIGSDNWLIFDRWRNHDAILQQYGVIIYPRPGYEIARPVDPRAMLIEAPCIEISSSFIRESISLGLDMRAFLPQGVNSYISQHHLYL